MSCPIVSVIIPAYKQAEFLAETIQSVLNQTFTDFEIVVVNDASPDHTEDVVKQFRDPRLKYIRHEKNRGLPAARNTGMQAARGEFIALLDADDLFHPKKLETHIKFLKNHPDIGVTYNNRFELHHSSVTIRDIWCPPETVQLRDLLLGFPFSPSDMVIRQEWAFKVGLFDESYIYGGEDVDFPLRLALAGCRFANVNATLNNRRYHAGRKRKNLTGRIGDYNRALENAFSDSRCPPDHLGLRNNAYASKYLEVAYLALSQDETELGQELVRELIRLDPAIISGEPCRLVEGFLKYSIEDQSLSHEDVLQDIFNRLPAEFSALYNQNKWATAQGYLVRGSLNLIWNPDSQIGNDLIYKAGQQGALLSKSFLRFLVDRIMKYEEEFSAEDAQQVVGKLSANLAILDSGSDLHWLQGCLLINRAFQDYHDGNFKTVPLNVLRAIIKDHTHISNRGVIKIFARSLSSIILQQGVTNSDSKVFVNRSILL